MKTKVIAILLAAVSSLSGCANDDSLLRTIVDAGTRSLTQQPGNIRTTPLVPKAVTEIVAWGQADIATAICDRS